VADLEQDGSPHGDDALTPASPDPTPALPDVELARMLDLLSDLVARYRVDDLRLTYCNRAWAAQFKAAPSDLIGTRLDRWLNDEERAGLRAQLARLGPDNPFLRDEVPRPASRNPFRYVEWADRYLPLPGGAEILAVGRDVTERHVAQVRLAASEVLFRTFAEAAIDLVWRLTIRPKPALSYVSPSVHALTGWRVDDLSGGIDRLREVVDEDGARVLERALAGEEPPERFDMRMRRADSSWITLEMQVVKLPDGWQGIGRDVTQIRLLQEELAGLALRDPLTGLANRRLLDILMEAALARIDRTGAPLTVSLVDLDDFKAINDQLGHAAGDEVLRQAAHRLVGTVRGADVVARLGGDEFVVAHESDASDGGSVLERLTAVLSEPYELADGTRLICLPSIGTADTRDHEHPLHAADLLAAADAAMYTAKRAHRAERRADATWITPPGPAPDTDGTTPHD
jgi:diguanylate cyclase (GGDEF)-like protein/PAS domain S-box-containing protein